MIDFKAITQSTFGYNFHTHTQFCDGHAPMEAFVQQAIELGYTHLGFTPHGPVGVDSACNMTSHSVDLYLTEIERLRRRYGRQIAIYAGIEADYIGGLQPSGLARLPLDYRIGSVHFIPAFDDPATYVDIDGRYERFEPKMHRYFHDDIEAVVRSYFEQSMRMVEAGGFDIIGHFDKIGYNASCFSPGIDCEPWYDRLVGQLFEAIIDHHYAVEINTKAWRDHGRFYPNQRYWNQLKRSGVAIVINSDAHYPHLLAAGRQEAQAAYAQL